MTWPTAADPAGIRTLPSISTGSATLALKLSPLLLILEPTAWPNRTVNVIPADSVDCLLRKKLGATLESDCWSPDFEQPKDASNSKVRKIVRRRCIRTSLRNSHPTVAVTGAEGAERPKPLVF